MIEYGLFGATRNALLFFIAFLVVVFGSLYRNELYKNDWVDRILGGISDKQINELNQKTPTKTPRKFLLTLERSIENCKTEGSLCEAYRSYETNIIMRSNCQDFAKAAYFHTTSAYHESCGIDDSFSSSSSSSSSSSFEKDKDAFLKSDTESIDKFVKELSSPSMENKMCYVELMPEDKYHALALETRQNNIFYIYNSWKNAFSNSWFSGLNNTADFISTIIFSNAVKYSFIDYKTKCGLGMGLTKFELQNCFKQLTIILKRITGKSSKVNFKYMCKNLNQDFKNLE